MKQKIYYLGLASAIILMTGTMFKVNHWPGALILLCLGTVLILAGFLPLALINHYRGSGEKQYRILYTITWVTCVIVFTAMLFKIMHWPFAGYLLFIAVPFPFVVFLPVWLYVTSRIKNFDINNTIYVLFLLALQAVFSVLLALNVSKEKLDLTMQVESQLSSFNTKVEMLQSGSARSDLINSANELLIQIEECRRLLYKRTGIAPDDPSKANTSNRYLDARNVAGNLILVPGEYSPAMKLESALRSFIAELQKHPESKDLAMQVIDLFELNGFTNQNIYWSEKMFEDTYLTWVLVNLDTFENFARVIRIQI